jgi:DNA polymerase-3 subunit delta'
MITHHALLYRGSKEWALKEFAAKLPENRHLVSLVCDEWGIDDSRTLIGQAHLTPLVEKESVFLVCFLRMTVEAQNALLKLVEEPPPRTSFVFVTNDWSHLLDTFRSRLHREDVEERQTPRAEARGVFALTLAARLATIENCVKKKDMAWLASVKHEALDILRQEASLPIAIRVRALYAAELLGARGSANKMLLEELAFLIPLRP